MRERKLVLLIEDNPAEREMYGKLLWYNGFDIVFAQDGQAGLELAMAEQPDLVLTDLGLPDIDGIDVCRQLKRDAATAATPVVALSARAQSQAGKRARLAGCVEYLEKPISPYDVLKRIEQLIGRQPPPDTRSDRVA